MTALLVAVHGTPAVHSVSDSLTGNLASSLHRLKDETDVEGGFFIFGDLSVKVEGIYKLQFNLHEKRNDEVFYVTSIDSIPFYVVEATRYLNPIESTALTTKFCDQGMRLRLRKAHQVVVRKGIRSSTDYFPGAKKKRRIRRGPRGVHGSSMQRRESETEESSSVPLQSIELRPAPSYIPQQEMPSHPPATIPDPYLQALLTQRQRISPHQPHSTQSYTEPYQGLSYSDDQSQQLSYNQGLYSLGPMAASIPGQLLDPRLDPRLLQQAMSTHPGDTGGPSTYYQQHPYLPQHSIPGVADFGSPEDKPLLPNINNVQEMRQGTFQFDRPLVMPGDVLPEEHVRHMGHEGHRTDLDAFHLSPSAGQNLSAGSMGRELSRPPSDNTAPGTSALPGAS